MNSILEIISDNFGTEVEKDSVDSVLNLFCETWMTTVSLMH